MEEVSISHWPKKFPQHHCISPKKLIENNDDSNNNPSASVNASEGNATKIQTGTLLINTKRILVWRTNSNKISFYEINVSANNNMNYYQNNNNTVQKLSIIDTIDDNHSSLQLILPNNTMPCHNGIHVGFTNDDYNDIRSQTYLSISVVTTKHTIHILKFPLLYITSSTNNIIKTTVFGHVPKKKNNNNIINNNITNSQNIYETHIPIPSFETSYTLPSVDDEKRTVISKCISACWINNGQTVMCGGVDGVLRCGTFKINDPNNSNKILNRINLFDASRMQRVWQAFGYANVSNKGHIVAIGSISDMGVDDINNDMIDNDILLFSLHSNLKLRIWSLNHHKCRSTTTIPINSENNENDESNALNINNISMNVYRTGGSHAFCINVLHEKKLYICRGTNDSITTENINNDDIVKLSEWRIGPIAKMTRNNNDTDVISSDNLNNQKLISSNITPCLSQLYSLYNINNNTATTTTTTTTTNNNNNNNNNNNTTTLICHDTKNNNNDENFNNEFTLRLLENIHNEYKLYDRTHEPQLIDMKYHDANEEDVFAKLTNQSTEEEINNCILIQSKQNLLKQKYLLNNLRISHEEFYLERIFYPGRFTYSTILLALQKRFPGRRFNLPMLPSSNNNYNNNGTNSNESNANNSNKNIMRLQVEVLRAVQDSVQNIISSTSTYQNIHTKLGLNNNINMAIGSVSNNNKNELNNVDQNYNYGVEKIKLQIKSSNKIWIELLELCNDIWKKNSIPLGINIITPNDNNHSNYHLNESHTSHENIIILIRYGSISIMRSHDRVESLYWNANSITLNNNIDNKHELKILSTIINCGNRIAEQCTDNSDEKRCCDETIVAFEKHLTYQQGIGYLLKCAEKIANSGAIKAAGCGDGSFDVLINKTLNDICNNNRDIFKNNILRILSDCGEALIGNNGNIDDNNIQKNALNDTQVLSTSTSRSFLHGFIQAVKSRFIIVRNIVLLLDFLPTNDEFTNHNYHQNNTLLNYLPNTDTKNQLLERSSILLHSLYILKWLCTLTATTSTSELSWLSQLTQICHNPTNSILLEQNSQNQINNINILNSNNNNNNTIFLKPGSSILKSYISYIVGNSIIGNNSLNNWFTNQNNFNYIIKKLMGSSCCDNNSKNTDNVNIITFLRNYQQYMWLTECTTLLLNESSLDDPFDEADDDVDSLFEDLDNLGGDSLPTCRKKIIAYEPIQHYGFNFKSRTIILLNAECKLSKGMEYTIHARMAQTNNRNNLQNIPNSTTTFATGQQQQYLGARISFLAATPSYHETRTNDNNINGLTNNNNIQSKLNINGIILQYNLCVMKIFERFEQPDHAREFAYAALHRMNVNLYAPKSWNNHNETMDNKNIKQILWVSIFNYSLQLAEYDESYMAASKIDDKKTRDDCLCKLVVRLCERKQLRHLCSLPTGGSSANNVNCSNDIIKTLEDALTWKAKNSNISISGMNSSGYSAGTGGKIMPTYYHFLYSFHMSHSKYEKAAESMYQLAKRCDKKITNINIIAKQRKKMMTDESDNEEKKANNSDPSNIFSHYANMEYYHEILIYLRRQADALTTASVTLELLPDNVHTEKKILDTWNPASHENDYITLSSIRKKLSLVCYLTLWITTFSPELRVNILNIFKSGIIKIGFSIKHKFRFIK